jgi:hypothetical protein
VALFGMTALRQFGAIVEAVQKGEEIGGADPLHVVPESLTSELIGSQWQEACQHRLLIPGADLRFACRRDTTVQGSQQKLLPDRRCRIPDHAESLDLSCAGTPFGPLAMRHNPNAKTNPATLEA